MVDVPFSVLKDLDAYRELQSVIGQRPKGFSETGWSVVQLPDDWVNGCPVNKRMARDMKGLSSRLEKEEVRLGKFDDLFKNRQKADDALIKSWMEKNRS